MAEVVREPADMGAAAKLLGAVEAVGELGNVAFVGCAFG
jgi:hypothetical protein